jgi:Carboxypeptidase regulatory-like domain/TonB dependent receptor
MRKMWSLGMLVVALVALLCTANVAWGQDVTATITGTITDPSGAPVVGATVTAHDTERGTNWTSLTNESGVYNLIRIPVGTYDLKVEQKGFQTAVRSAFTLVLNQTARIDVQMTLGSVSQTVEVSGATPLLQTESTEVSTLIDSHSVTTLPLAGRNYLQLALLTPGATTNNPNGISEPHNLDNQSRPFINGNREQANQYFLDGQLNSEDKNNETSYTPNVDAIQEFNIITQNASAEFGNYEGGIVSVSTRAGTNNFHGSIFEFFRNDALNANLPSNSWSRGVVGAEGTVGHAKDGTILKPEFRYNEYGATIGGPIIKNKLFFFADYQGLRDLNAGATGAQLLTSRMRTGDFGQFCAGGFDGTGLCKDRGTDANGKPIVLDQVVVPGSSGPGGNTTLYVNPADRPAGTGANPTPVQNNNFSAPGANGGPYTISPVAQNLFASKFYPLPQIDSVTVGNNFFYNTGTEINNDQGDFRIDYNISDKDHLFGRWSQGHLRNPAFSGCAFCNNGSAQGADQPMRNAVVDWTHSFSSTLQNDARIGFNAVQFNQSLVQTSGLGNIGEQLGIAGANFQVPGLLNIQIPGFEGGAPSLGQQNLVQIFHTTQGQFSDNLTIIHNRHSIKTGFQYVRLRQDYLYNGNNGALGAIGIPGNTGFGLSDLYLGIASGGVRDAYVNPQLFGDRGNLYAAFVQDDWRITKTLTLNLGMRFEDHTPLYEIKNRAVNFDLQTGAIIPATSSHRQLYDNYLGRGDWEPRFGFAWSPEMLGGKTVIRGGYAISSFFEGGGANEQPSLNPPFGIIGQGPVGGTLSAGYAAPTSCTAINFACYAGIRIRVTDQHIRPAMNQQWNLTIQHQFSNTLTAQIGYVGQHGTHLLNFMDTTQLRGLNAAGTIAKPGQQIVTRAPGAFLGGGTPGSLYEADNSFFNPAGCSTKPPTVTGNPPCGADAIAGTNMSNADQKYDALQAVLQKRMGDGLQGQLAYTWSKCMSNSPGYFGTGWGSTNATSSGGQPGWQNSYDGRSDWGPCFFDQTHIISSYVTYELPVGRGKKFGKDISPVLNQIIGNWEIGGIISFHTGNALTLNEFGGWGAFNGDPSKTNGIGNYFLSARPNCNGPVKVLNKFIPATTSNPAYIQWFDTGNITHPSNEFGTCSVGNFRGPHYSDVDLSLQKNFLITESKRLQFRLEMLNAFDHPVWTFSGGPAGGSFDPGTPVTGGLSSGNPNFGNITGSQSARQIQLALKFFF